MRLRRLAPICGIACCLAFTSLADMGAVPPRVGTISESEQNAIILYDARQKREALVLQTNLNADREISGLFFMPLPSAPRLSLAAPTLFGNMVEIAKARKMRYDTRQRATLGSGSPATSSGLGVLIHEQLGEHELTVLEVKSVSHFLQWVVQYRADHKIQTDFDFEAVRSMIEGYLKDGLHFFLIDRIDLGETEKTMHPLVIEFESAQIYYPLRVNKLYSGPSDVHLMILSPQSIPENRFTQVGFFATSPSIVNSVELTAAWEGFKTRSEGNLHFQCFRLADPRSLFLELYPYASPAYAKRQLGLEVQAKRRWEHDLRISFEEGKAFDPGYTVEAWPDL